jgi:RNA polymerase sigma-70 factor, ECF subfamily
MAGTSDQAAGAATAAGRVSRTEDDGAAASGAGPGFLEWVTRLVHTHRGRLCRLARREGLREEDSLDCVQDAFHTVLLLPQARQLVESNEDSSKLLSALVRNHARNRRRRHEIARPHDSGDETLALLAEEARPVDELIAQAQEFALMIGCLDHLGKLQRAVVSLRMLDEAPGQEVAALLGLPPAHVAVLLHRAKQNLRSCMLSAGYRPRTTAHRRSSVISRPIETY